MITSQQASGGNITSIDIPNGKPTKKSKWAVGQMLERERLLSEARNYFNPFGTVRELFADLGITQPSKLQWRLVIKAASGYIHGVPNSNGLLYATDGVLCLLYRTNKNHFIGHLENFVYDVGVDDVEVVKPIKEKKVKLLDQLLKDL